MNLTNENNAIAFDCKETSLTAEVIIKETAASFGLTSDEISGNDKSHKATQARLVALFLVRKLTNLTLGEIGKEFGMCVHTNAIPLIRQAEEAVSESPELTTVVKEITSKLRVKGGL